MDDAQGGDIVVFETGLVSYFRFAKLCGLISQVAVVGRYNGRRGAVPDQRPVDGRAPKGDEFAAGAKQ